MPLRRSNDPEAVDITVVIPAETYFYKAADGTERTFLRPEKPVIVTDLRHYLHPTKSNSDNSVHIPPDAEDQLSEHGICWVRQSSPYATPEAAAADVSAYYNGNHDVPSLTLAKFSRRYRFISCFGASTDNVIRIIRALFNGKRYSAVYVRTGSPMIGLPSCNLDRPPLCDSIARTVASWRRSSWPST